MSLTIQRPRMFQKSKHLNPIHKKTKANHFTESTWANIQEAIMMILVLDPPHSRKEDYVMIGIKGGGGGCYLMVKERYRGLWGQHLIGYLPQAGREPIMGLHWKGKLLFKSGKITASCRIYNSSLKSHTRKGRSKCNNHYKSPLIPMLTAMALHYVICQTGSGATGPTNLTVSTSSWTHLSKRPGS